MAPAACVTSTKNVALIKECSRCHLSKPFSSFSKDSAKTLGLASSCKQCHRKQRQSVKHKLLDMFYNARRRAKKNKIPFDLDTDYVINLFVEDCPLLGIKLDWTNRGYLKEDSPTIDKIFPELGYVYGNIWIVSAKANLMKGKATVEEINMLSNRLAQKIRELAV